MCYSAQGRVDFKAYKCLTAAKYCTVLGLRAKWAWLFNQGGLVRDRSHDDTR